MIAYTLTPDSLAVSDESNRVTLRGPVSSFWAREESRALSRDWTDAMDVLHHATAAGLTPSEDASEAPEAPEAPKTRKRAPKAKPAAMLQPGQCARKVLIDAIAALKPMRDLYDRVTLRDGWIVGNGVEVMGGPSDLTVTVDRSMLEKTLRASKDHGVTLALDAATRLLHVDGFKLVTHEEMCAPVPEVTVTATVDARALLAALARACDVGAELDEHRGDGVLLRVGKREVKVIGTDGARLRVSALVCRESHDTDVMGSLAPSSIATLAKLAKGVDEGAFATLGFGPEVTTVEVCGARIVHRSDTKMSAAFDAVPNAAQAEPLAYIHAYADDLRDICARAKVACKGEKTTRLWISVFGEDATFTAGTSTFNYREIIQSIGSTRGFTGGINAAFLLDAIGAEKSVRVDVIKVEEGLLWRIGDTVICPVKRKIDDAEGIFLDDVDAEEVRDAAE
jgi:hypothetical protein